MYCDFSRLLCSVEFFWISESVKHTAWNTALYSPHCVLSLCSQEKPLNQLLLAVSFLWFTLAVAIIARYSPTLVLPFFNSSWFIWLFWSTELVSLTGIVYDRDVQNLQAWPMKHPRGCPPWPSRFLWLESSNRRHGRGRILKMAELTRSLGLRKTEGDRVRGALSLDC